MSTVPMRITLDFTGGIKQTLGIIKMYEELYPAAYHAKGGSVQAIYSASPIGIPVEVSCEQELPSHLQTLHLLTHGQVEVSHQTTQDFHTLKALGFPVELTELEHMVLMGKHKKARRLIAKTMVELFEETELWWAGILAEAHGIVDGVPAYMPATAE